MGSRQFKGNTFPLLHPLDNSPETRAKVKFVQDTSKYWYKPEISREQGELWTALLVWWPIGRLHGLPLTMSALGKNSFLNSVGGGHREEAGIRVIKEKALPMERGGAVKSRSLKWSSKVLVFPGKVKCQSRDLKL